MSTKSKNDLGVPRPKKAGSGSPSKSSRPKTVAPGFPSDPSRKMITMTHEEFGALLITGRNTVPVGLSPQPTHYDGMWMLGQGVRWGAVSNPNPPKCPYGEIGDTIRVRNGDTGLVRLATIEKSRLHREEGFDDEGATFHWSWMMSLALGIGADRPKGGVRSAAKDGTRAKPGASRATPKNKLKTKYDEHPDRRH